MKQKLTFAPSQEIMDQIDNKLNDLLSELLDNNSQPVIGEFYLCLLGFAQDIYNSYKMEVISSPPPEEDQKILNSKMN